jgi:hypothetical protein
MATPKQTKAIKHILEGDSVSKAMRKAGYAKATSRNPDHLTKSIAFTEVMEKVGISDKKLAQKLNEGLDATKTIVMGTKSEESFVDVQPDFLTRHRYLETTLKIKGHMRDNPPANILVIPIYGGLSGKPDDISIPGHSRYPKDFRPQETY